ncbi:MAG: hypothetical protein V4671_08680 [Armatimonadota bacterium]
MSIFGPKDKDVHILTHYYQLEFNPGDPIGSEIDKWLVLLLFGWRLPKNQDGTPLFETWIDYGSWSSRSSDTPELYIKGLYDVAGLQWMVRTLMDSMADRDLQYDVMGNNEEVSFNSPSIPWIRAFEQLNRLAIDLRPVLGWRHMDEPMRDSKPLKVVWQGPHSGPARAIVSELVQELARGYEVFRRCPICSSVFVANGRQDQKYCSNRCRNRSAVKKFRDKSIK